MRNLERWVVVRHDRQVRRLLSLVATFELFFAGGADLFLAALVLLGCQITRRAMIPQECVMVRVEDVAGVRHSGKLPCGVLALHKGGDEVPRHALSEAKHSVFCVSVAVRFGALDNLVRMTFIMNRNRLCR